MFEFKLDPESKHCPVDQAKIALAIYALDKFDYKRDAAKWLGVSVRGLRYWFDKYEELMKYKGIYEPEDDDYMLDY